MQNNINGFARIEEKKLSDGETLDQFGDMLTPAELVEMLDRKCLQEQIAGIFQILEARFRADSEARR